MPLTPHNDGYGLLIGDDRVTGQPLYYPATDERGLVTIAAPGAGKTQCFMLPNLMTYRGPAIVLDVKGELWELTSAKRSTFGPVYRLDLDAIGESDCYNPFTVIRTDPDHAWGDAQTFADLVYARQASQTSSDGGFYDNQAMQFIAAMACFVAVREREPLRNPMRLVSYVSGGDMAGFISVAETMSDVPGLQNAAASIKRYDPRTLGNVIATARDCLNPWNDPQIARLSRVSDWTPDMIRRHNATLYVKASSGTLKKNRALVRVVIGQHLRALLSDSVDRIRTPWTQIFLDETPQLRNMSVLPETIEVGRDHKVRLWMVMQWKAQLVEAYGKDTAEGMIAACGLQTYLNPGLQDGLAAALSDHIGIHENRLDGTRQPKVSAQKLSGVDFKDHVIAFDHNVYKRLRKHFYSGDRKLTAMAGQSP